MDGQRRIKQLAYWWANAAEEDRFVLLQKAIDGETKEVSLKEVQLAAIIAEADKEQLTKIGQAGAARER